MYTRWCKWCGLTIATDRPWQEHRDAHARDTHADDPEVSKTVTLSRTKQQDHEDCEFIRLDSSEWYCTVHDVTMVQKHEPVHCGGCEL